ncbi:MAG TPA: glycosyltransferase family 87 protein [Allocoleopsis sp.]
MPRERRSRTNNWLFSKLRDLQQQISNPTLLIAVLVIQLLVIVLVFHFCEWPYVQTPQHTLYLYYNYARQLLAGSVPYRDFPLEYPPLSLFAFVLPNLVKFGQSLRYESYVWLFVLENVIWSMATTLVLVRVVSFLQPKHRLTQVLLVYVVLVAIAAPILADRYDLFPALLTLVSLLCVLEQCSTWAGIWLGLGIVAKLYPVVLLPIFSVYYLMNREYRSLLGFLLGTIGSAVLTLLPFALLAQGHLLSFLSYHKARGLQIETLPAGMISLGRVLGLTQAKWTFRYGAFEIVSPFDERVLQWLPLVFILTTLGVIISCFTHFRYERITYGEITGESLVIYVLIALLAFIVTSKVFSPQYIIWLLPFAPLLSLRQASVLAAVFAMTIAIYPFWYSALLDFQPSLVVLLNLRNLLTVVLLLWLLRDRMSVTP